jgi:hypothetical protein
MTEIEKLVIDNVVCNFTEHYTAGLIKEKSNIGLHYSEDVLQYSESFKRPHQFTIKNSGYMAHKTDTTYDDEITYHPITSYLPVLKRFKYFRKVRVVPVKTTKWFEVAIRIDSEVSRRLFLYAEDNKEAYDYCLNKFNEVSSTIEELIEQQEVLREENVLNVLRDSLKKCEKVNNK